MFGVVKMPLQFKDPLGMFEKKIRKIPYSGFYLGRYANVWCCEGLSTIPLQLKDPNGHIREEKGNTSPVSGFHIVAVWPNPPSNLQINSVG